MPHLGGGEAARVSRNLNAPLVHAGVGESLDEQGGCLAGGRGTGGGCRQREADGGQLAGLALFEGPVVNELHLSVNGAWARAGGRADTGNQE